MLFPIIVIGAAVGTASVYGFLFGLIVGAETCKGIHYDEKTKKWTTSKSKVSKIDTKGKHKWHTI